MLTTAKSSGALRTEFDIQKGKPMYAIAFDMDIESLKSNYSDRYNNAYIEVRKVLQPHGFNWQQGSVYFGGEAMNAVHACRRHLVGTVLGFGTAFLTLGAMNLWVGLRR
jgi:hypothetical protein